VHPPQGTPMRDFDCHRRLHHPRFSIIGANAPDAIESLIVISWSHGDDR
jgi:hypothetical protein